jgi:hypothetical protein
MMITMLKNKAIQIVMVLFFLMPFQIFSQITLQGTIIKEISSEPIPYVNILIKNTEGSYLIDFASTDENGKYSIKLAKDVDTILVETSIISHLPKIHLLILDKTKNIHTLNFSLSQRLTELEEVFIESEKKPITVKKDTTVYNVSQFKDGSERVVEDLLKKLPGISIEDNGVIKFKGKQVVRLLLDNDNIFNSNYTIGTKNIDSEIIEEVQAIEDYNINPLLKGIKTSEDVAINLVLKKGKTDISGNTEIGLGLKIKKFIKVNTVSVSKKLKGFSTISYNNIGENYSPYNFTSNTLELSKINEFQQRTNNLVNSLGFNSNLPNNRISINNNFFGSINALYKINKKSSFRANYNLFKDKLIRRESYNTIYNFNNEELSIANQKHITKKPLLNTFEYEFIYHINKKSLLTSIGKWDARTIKKSSFGFNNDFDFENITKSKDMFLMSNTEYTYRINNQNVFQLLGNISSNNIPQNVNVFFQGDEFKQSIDFKKNYLKLQLSLLSKTENSEYEYNLGYNFTENFIDSELSGIEINNQNLLNNNYYKFTRLYANFKHSFRINKWRFIYELNNNLYNVKLTENNLQSNYNNTFVNIRPIVSINYYLNKVSHFYLNYTLSNHLPEANNVYSGLILTDNRTLFNNNFKFNLFNNHTSSFGYRISDFYNLFQFNVLARYSFRKFGYVNQLNIDENIDFYTSIVDATNNERLDFSLDFEKYIHFLKVTININGSYRISDYQNIINNSQLRNNTSKSLLGQLDIRTGFNGNMNFENKVMLRNNFYSSSSSSSNSFTSFQNDFKIKYLKNNFQFILNSQYFKPDLDKNNSGDLFLDAILNYKTKSGKIEYQIKANNLLNKKKYRNINTSDYSTSIFEHNLIERFALLSVNFKF